CPNLECPGRRLEGLVHFASRGAMDIRGLSYARLRQLVEADLVRDAADLYDLTAQQLADLERLAEKSADALVAAVDASRAQPLSRLLFALGVEHIGEIAARQIARHFGSMDALAGASRDDILAIHGIGETIAESLASWFSNPDARRLVERLAERRVTMTEPQASSGGALKGLSIVITGTLPTLSREQAIALVEANGRSE